MEISYRPTEVPDEPGVYRFFDDSGKVLYVGKAKSLKNRLNSYFQKNVPEKTQRLVHAASRVDWTLVNSEVEALQLEFTWIKEENPPFNVQFKDDKSYPYLAISIKDEFPRLFITRSEKVKGVKYFGPYAHSWALRTTYDLLLETFPIRSCSASNFEKAKRSMRHCLLGDIGKCSAPCVSRVNAIEHRESVDRLIKFMDHGGNDIEVHLKEAMAKASAEEDFERAARLRDRLNALAVATESSDAAISEAISGDFISIHDDITHSAASIFKIRNGRVVGSRSWIVDRSNLLEDQDLIGATLDLIYRDADIPNEIFLNLSIPDLNELAQILSSRANHKVTISIPERGEKLEILKTVKRNAQQEYESKIYFERCTRGCLNGVFFL